MDTELLEQLARLVLPKEILDHFDIVQIETDEADIDAMTMTIHLDERMSRYLQKSEEYESKGFMEPVRVTESGTRYSKEFAAFLKETYGDIPSDLPYA